MTAVLSIGSNVGNRMAMLRLAVEVLQPYAVSPVYETSAVGGVRQGDFLNAVLLCRLAAGPAWERAQEAEQRAGRERSVRWGPRTLDVDVIVAFGSAPGIVLPHPRAHERAFVLAPWHDVDPKAHQPRHGAVSELLERLGLDGVRRRPESHT